MSGFLGGVSRISGDREGGRQGVCLYPKRQMWEHAGGLGKRAENNE